MGRPTKYKPEFAQMAVDYLDQGFSITAFAAEINVSRECVYNWAETIPAFSDALKAAKAKRTRWWENKLRQAVSGPDVTAAIFALKNVQRDEWADRYQQELTGPNGGPIETRSVVELSDEDLARIAGGSK